MNKKIVPILLLSVLITMMSLRNAQAAQITSATADHPTYLAGQTGYMSVNIYNDRSEKIRVTQLSVNLDYYYTDGTVYMQTFYYPSGSLPDEIPAGQTKTYQVAISLPNNIAPGYPNTRVQAGTELWQPMTSRWIGSDYPSYHDLKFYIESPFKQLYGTSQQYATILGVTTIVFAGAVAFLMFLAYARRPRPVAQ